jgi:hypothetical protein
LALALVFCVAIQDPQINIRGLSGPAKKSPRF